MKNLATTAAMFKEVESKSTRWYKRLAEHIIDTLALVMGAIFLVYLGFFVFVMSCNVSCNALGALPVIPGLILLFAAARQWYADRLEEMHGYSRHALPQDISDATLAKTAKKYAGVLTKTVIAYELETTLEKAQGALARYVKHGEARKIQVGEMAIYAIPSARIHLLGADKVIVELIIRNKGRVTRAQLLRESGQSVEALDAGLNRLEGQGILIRNPDNTYRLSVFT